MSKVNWDKTEWDPLATKNRPLPRPKRDTGYVSSLWPPPGDPRAAHPPTSRFRVVSDNEK